MKQEQVSSKPVFLGFLLFVLAFYPILGTTFLFGAMHLPGPASTQIVRVVVAVAAFGFQMAVIRVLLTRGYGNALYQHYLERHAAKQTREQAKGKRSVA